MPKFVAMISTSSVPRVKRSRGRSCAGVVLRQGVEPVVETAIAARQSNAYFQPEVATNHAQCKEQHHVAQREHQAATKDAAMIRETDKV